jgi:hypothetical protein
LHPLFFFAGPFCLAEFVVKMIDCQDDHDSCQRRRCVRRKRLSSCDLERDPGTWSSRPLSARFIRSARVPGHDPTWTLFLRCSCS